MDVSARFGQAVSRRFRIVEITFALLIGCALTACGGGGGGSSSSSQLTANAGADQTVKEGATVTLDGSASSGSGLTYSWTQTAGPNVTLSSTSVLKPTFTAPSVAGGTTLTFELTISSGSKSASDSVSIAVSDATVATATVTSGGIRDDIVITFSEEMDTSSLALGAGLADISDKGTWSQGNTVFTLKPDDMGAWESGNQPLKLTVDDSAGNETAVDTTVGIDFTISTFKSASVVIGQKDFTSNAANQGGPVAADTLRGPYGPVSYIDGRLWIPDFSNNRALGFDGIPAVNDASASFVIGQTGFTQVAGGTAAQTTRSPLQLLENNGLYYLLSYDDSRILIYNTAPLTPPGTADAVIGQTDFTSTSGSCSAGSVGGPAAMSIVDGKLVVADFDNNRVLVWNSVPTATGVAPDMVLGQSDFTHCAANVGGAPTASTLNNPAAVWSDGTKLVVSDSSNNRVLIWNSFPTQNFQAADVVLGQGDFTSNAVNNGGAPSAITLSDPENGVWSNGRQMIVADSGNNRVLIWNSFPSANSQSADVVLGQSNFTNIGASTSERELSYPAGETLIRDQLVVQDPGNNRTLIFKAD